jgi:hypothetical protein
MAISANKNVVVDDSALMAHLKDFAKLMGKELSEVIRDQAAAFCIDMIKNTRPYKSKGKGMDKDAKAKGIKNVHDSVFHIFRPLDLATAEQVAAIGRFDVFKMWEKRQGKTAEGGKSKKLRWARFQQAFSGGKSIPFVESGDQSALGSIHTRLRRDGGRGSLTETAAKSKEPFAIVAREKDVENYAKLKARDVGLLKSAYYHAALRIRADVKGSSWVKHPAGSSNAIGEDKTTQPLTPFVVVGNLKGYRGVTPSLVQAALNHRAYAMRNAMARELNKNKVSWWSATITGRLSNTYQHFT